MRKRDLVTELGYGIERRDKLIAKEIQIAMIFAVEITRL